MRAEYLQFEHALSELRSHVHANAQFEATLSALRKGTPATEIEQSLAEILSQTEAISRRKRFEYNSTIISLSAIFETFVENLIGSYLKSLKNNYTRYSQLPERLRAQHLSLSIELLSRLNQTRYRNDLDLPTIFSRIDSCFSGRKQYQLNDEALLNHWANFRSNVLEEYCARVDIPNATQKLLQTGEIDNFLTENSLPYQGLQLLNHIMDIRNEVAHGENCNVEDREYQQLYINYFLVLGKNLYEVVTSRSLELHVKKSSKKLRNFLNIFRKKIVCFRPTPVNISSFDTIIVADSNGRWRESRILSMRADGDTVTEAKRGDRRGIGIALEFDVKAGCDFFIARGHPPAPLPLAANEAVDEELLGSAPNDEDISDFEPE